MTEFKGKLVREAKSTHPHVQLLTRVLKFESSISNYFSCEPFSDRLLWLLFDSSENEKGNNKFKTL